MRWLAILLASALPAAAGDLDLTHQGFVIFRGDIVPGDALRLGIALRSAKPIDGRVHLMLDSVGGDYEEGVRMADAVTRAQRSAIIRADVPWTWSCSSACITVFAAAKEREIGRAGQDKDGTRWGWGELRVHTVASIIKGVPVVDDDAMADTWAWSIVLRTMHVPSPIIDKLLHTRSRAGVVLTEDELKQWGVAFRDP